jgi:hypothetical protein
MAEILVNPRKSAESVPSLSLGSLFETVEGDIFSKIPDDFAMKPVFSGNALLSYHHTTPRNALWRRAKPEQFGRILQVSLVASMVSSGGMLTSS